LEFYAASNCFDTDWYTFLTDVYQDDKSILIAYGIQRARYRDGLRNQELLIPGKIYKYTIEMNSTSISIEKGHRLRLAITSSAFPRYARNLNTGNPILDDTEIKIATNTVYHGLNYPSILSLPQRK
jgi:putative CocE/NonD family hydrolase